MSVPSPRSTVNHRRQTLSLSQRRGPQLGAKQRFVSNPANRASSVSRTTRLASACRSSDRADEKPSGRTLRPPGSRCDRSHEVDSSSSGDQRLEVEPSDATFVASSSAVSSNREEHAGLLVLAVHTTRKLHREQGLAAAGASADQGRPAARQAATVIRRRRRCRTEPCRSGDGFVRGLLCWRVARGDTRKLGPPFSRPAPRSQLRINRLTERWVATPCAIARVRRQDGVFASARRSHVFSATA